MTIELPDPIGTRILEFVATRKTGQVAINFFEGSMLNADVKEHIRAAEVSTAERERIKAYVRRLLS